MSGRFAIYPFVTMTIAPPPAEAIRFLDRMVIEHAPAEVRAPLFAQAETLEYVDGPVTMMRLRVTDEAARTSGVVSPVPGGPHVFDDDGNAIGGLILWLDGDGYIDCLEYWWVTDDMPTELPSPSQVRRS
jgi:hypothetical protein